MEAMSGSKVDRPEWWQAWEREKEAAAPELRRWLSQQRRGAGRDLNRRAQAAHDRAFDRINCLDCANCCKSLPALVTRSDIERISRHLGMSTRDFTAEYTRLDEDGDRVIDGAPCPFLRPDNHCSIYEQRPRSCRQYPHTGGNAFTDHLKLHSANAAWCPAVHHILKDLSSE